MRLKDAIEISILPIKAQVPVTQVLCGQNGLESPKFHDTLQASMQLHHK